MKLIVVTILLAFLTGAGAVVIFNRLAPAKASPEADLESPDPPRSPPIAGSIEPQEQTDTATIADLPIPGSPADIEVELTGFQDRWTIHLLDRPESGEKTDGSRASRRTESLKLPVNSNVRLTLKSRDFVYMLSLPQINKAQIAVPGRSFTLEFRTLSTGSFSLRGNHVCGPPRPTLTIKAAVTPMGKIEDPLDPIIHLSRDTPNETLK